jgi:hypothetical protein
VIAASDPKAEQNGFFRRALHGVSSPSQFAQPGIATQILQVRIFCDTNAVSAKIMK